MKPDNVFIIIADSLRFNSVYSNGSPCLPYIENHSIQFIEARSAGCWTLPATASLFTGKLTHEHGATCQTRFLSGKFPTLAETFENNGYKTYQITANVATTEVFGLDRGFDEIHKIWLSVDPQYRLFIRLLVFMSKPRFRKILKSKDQIVSKLSQDLQMGNSWLQNTYSEIFNKTRELLKQNEKENKKGFFFLNLMESHFPYHAFPKMGLYSETFKDKLLEISSLYHIINQSFLKDDKEFINEKGREIIAERQRKSWEILRKPIDDFVNEIHQNKNNLVVFLSDHGDNFGEQNWYYHFSNVTDAGNKVPMFWLDNDDVRSEIICFPVSSRFLFNAVINKILPNNDSLLFKETAENLPILQSYWYNNMGKTLEKYIYNQFAFIQQDMRYINRNGKWYEAPVSKNCFEPEMTEIPDIDPIEEIVKDSSRKSYIEKSFKDFSIFSKVILEKAKSKNL